MGKLGAFVSCGCLRGTRAAVEPAKRQAVSVEACGRKVLEKPPTENAIKTEQKLNTCETGQLATQSVPREPTANPRLKTEDERAILASELTATSTGETQENGVPKLQVVVTHHHNAAGEMPTGAPLSSPQQVSKGAPTDLEGKFKGTDTGGGRTSRDTAPDHESRASSSLVSMTCLTSTSGGDEDSRIVVSSLPAPQSLGSDKENAEHESGAKTEEEKSSNCSPTGSAAVGGDQAAAVPIEGGNVSCGNSSPEASEKKDAKTDEAVELLGKNSIENKTFDDLKQTHDAREELDGKARDEMHSGDGNDQPQCEQEVAPAEGKYVVSSAVAEDATSDSNVNDGNSCSGDQGEDTPASESTEKGKPRTLSSRKFKKKKTSKARGKRRHGKTGRR
ncbi:hypothetical protein, conserved [Eimeria tenella]|uniref:Uncharacterized protein n=1 Tax=Eimeria tenella TaxID=5802 RepID=U6KZ88_EIMTE|nr:hypothetical protein, conserved [Eimeria tenella]CDJ43452.1 hypothetical protein, conserved [Eimeria tenella]|eukprot:XP_013234202.1 hypothetical protein, conserved [Eimeria tenella]